MSSRKNKGFKPETIRKITRALRDLVNQYEKQIARGGKIDLVISNGNIKIGNTMNVSIAPIITCKNCRNCKFHCYDVKACLQYKNVRTARAKNTALFMSDRDLFFSQLWDRMSRRRVNKFLRFHVSGEIVDLDHFCRIVETARRFPDFRIWTYTKVYWIVNEYCRIYGKESIPENLSVMFSEWRGVPIDNPFSFPVFRCIEEGEQIPEGMNHCPGNCNACKLSGTGCIYGESMYVYLH